jgi:hypothetical protein
LSSAAAVDNRHAQSGPLVGGNYHKPETACAHTLGPTTHSTASFDTYMCPSRAAAQADLEVKLATRVCSSQGHTDWHRDCKKLTSTSPGIWKKSCLALRVVWVMLAAVQVLYRCLPLQAS